jgi:Domain of unknown function (DUF6438)/Ankyrin repeats (3 copies)
MPSALIRVVPAALVAITVAVYAPIATAQTVAVADDVVIKLERTSCFGECPVYTVTIDAHGTVIYDGAKAVRVVGRQTDRIPLSHVAAILETAERIGFFGLKDQYHSIQNADGSLREVEIDDIADAFVTITRQGRSKRVRDHIGAPEGLKQLERQIDEATRTKRWILLDEQTLDQMVRDGWRPTPEERADLLRRALERDEVGVVKGLIDVGADPNGTYFGTNTPPLMMVQSAAAARVLLNAGANPTARNDNGGTPLGWSICLAPDVAELLLKAGARVDEYSDRVGGTPLWYAAGRGNVGVVSVFLGAGADPSVRRLGQSVLECTKNARDAYRLRESPALYRQPYVEDFDGVISLLEQALAKRSRR